MVAAHTDSPCLKVKPISKRRAKEGLIQVAVEPYGGGLWHTWFDRDLGVAGKVVSLKEGNMKKCLVNVNKPILRIPTLAIHMDHTVKEAFSFNTEIHLNPVLASVSHDERAALRSRADPLVLSDAHEQALLDALQSDDESPETVLATDLCLYDVQKATLGGVHNEFILSARLDNLMLSFCVEEALVQSMDNLEDEDHIRMGIWFDHEEIGSQSAQGAMSAMVSATIDRIIFSEPNKLNFRHQAMVNSMLVSADMAHAVHPNYPEKSEEVHRPKMHGGVVIKYNANQRYATSSHTAAFIKFLANKEGIPVQEFMVRNDRPCGSTIGPIVAAQLGVDTIDIGLPQLSMHSIREMAATDDVEYGVRLLKAFYAEKW